MLNRRTLLKKAPLAGLASILGITSLAQGSSIKTAKPQASWKDGLKYREKIIDIITHEDGNINQANYVHQSFDSLETIVEYYKHPSRTNFERVKFQGIDSIKVAMADGVTHYFMLAEDFRNA